MGMEVTENLNRLPARQSVMPQVAAVESSQVIPHVFLEEMAEHVVEERLQAEQDLSEFGLALTQQQIQVLVVVALATTLTLLVLTPQVVMVVLELS
jgi:hypothetical protein